MSIIALAFFAAVMPATSYDCTAERQLAVTTRGDEWRTNSQPVGRAERETFSWTFLLMETDDGTQRISHEAGILDAMGLAGEHEVIQLAEGQFAFTTTKERNCLFTEQSCAALVEISDIDDETAMFSITPAGSVRQSDGTREIFQMIMLGSCTKTEVTL